jgi:chaperonin GroES
MIKVQLLEDRVLIERDKTQDKSKGGVFLPEQARTRAPRGTVVAIGPGKRCAIAQAKTFS